MITGAVRIDMSSEEREGEALLDLTFIPDGAKVVVFVGGRTTWSLKAVDFLRRESPRLDVEVEGTLAAVQSWMPALRRQR
jgi:hypothetical protein